MKIKEIFDWGKKELKSVPVQESEASAEFLLRQVLGVDRAKFYTILSKEVRPLQERKYRKYIERRKSHEPVWQIVSKVQFWGMDFFVNKDVLVPRPETELLVKQVIQEITNNKKQITNKFQIQNSKFKILDVGTGSGAIAITLARELSLREKKDPLARHCESDSSDAAIPFSGQAPQSQKDRHASLAMTYDFVATDISEKALEIAKKNARGLKVKGIKFIKSDLFSNISGKSDFIIANLPYIPHEDVVTLAFDIHHYEPRVSLDGGKGGLLIYEEFLKQLISHLNHDGMVFCEIGSGQGKKFCSLAKKYLPKAKCKIIRDLAGLDRIAIIKSN